MVVKNITESLNNNMKRMVHAAVGSLQDPLPGDIAVVSADEYTVAVIPLKAVITKVYAVVTEVATGTTATANVKIDGTSVTALDAIDLKTAGMTAGTGVESYTGELSQLVSVTPTYASASGGTIKVFVEYIEDAKTLMYAAEQ